MHYMCVQIAFKWNSPQVTFYRYTSNSRKNCPSHVCVFNAMGGQLTFPHLYIARKYWAVISVLRLEKLKKQAIFCNEICRLISVIEWL